jgi:hypothetical protein
MAKITKPASAAAKSKGTKGQPVAQTTDNLETEDMTTLNFKVPRTFKRDFKTYATEQDMSMRELLEKAFEMYRNSN